jgi:hypothetical protein
LKDITTFGGYMTIEDLEPYFRRPITIRITKRIAKETGEQADRHFKSLSHGKQNRLLRRVKR